MVIRERVSNFLVRLNQKPRYLLLFVGLLALLVLLPVAPHLQNLPNTDSSVFLYMGQRILKGDVPYLNVWDHKGPVIYYLNAIGLALGADSRWGVWLLEVLGLVTAAALGFDLMRRAFGAREALLASLLWLFTVPALLQGGNLSEEYALPLQFAVLWLFWMAQAGRRRWAYVLLGVCAGLIFLLRPNLIAIPITVVLYLLWQAPNRPAEHKWDNLTAVEIGGLIPLALTAAYFWLEGALPALWDAMFRYNFLYSASGFADRWSSVAFGISQVALLFIFGFAAAVVALLRPNQWQDNGEPRKALVSVLLLALPGELHLASLPGNQHPHYFLAWLPVLAVLAALFFSFIFSAQTDSGDKEQGISLPSSISFGAATALIVLLLVNIGPSLGRTLTAITQDASLAVVLEEGDAELLAYIEEHAPDGKVLFWGHNLTFQWLGGFKSPTRFVYQTPLFDEAYVRPEMVDTFVEDIHAEQPLVIDTTPPVVSFPSLGVRLDRVPQALRPLYRYFDEHYALVEIMQPSGWAVYHYVGESP